MCRKVANYLIIEEVIYKGNNNEDELIKLSAIELRPDFEEVKRSLYCTFEGCNCKILYVPKGKRIAHFKTWPGENHSKECEAYFERIKSLKPSKGAATTTTRLTDKHIQNVLKEMGIRAKETEEERLYRLEQQRKKNKKTKKNPVSNNSNPTKTGLNIVPVVDNSADNLVSVERAPRVSRRYSINNIIEKDVGTALALREKIDRIEVINDRYVIINLVAQNGKTAKVFLEEAFFAQAPSNINSWIESIANMINSGIETTLSCVGNVILRENQLCLQVFAESHLRIGDLTIINFIMENN